VTDPFRPRPPEFPRARLLRARVEEATVDQLAETFGTLSRTEQVQLAHYVNSHGDDAIRERYGSGDTPEVTAEQLSVSTETAAADADAAAATAAADAAAQPTHDELDERYTVPQLRDKLAELSQPVSGTKPELIDRLLAAGYREPAEATATADAAPVTPATGTIDEQPTPAPEAAPAPPPAPAAADAPAATDTAAPSTVAAPVAEAPAPAVAPADAAPAALTGDAAQAQAPATAEQPPAEPAPAQPVTAPPVAGVDATTAPAPAEAPAPAPAGAQTADAAPAPGTTTEETSTR
jgi:hypothetical protein